jgi:hypothetical protein
MLIPRLLVVSLLIAVSVAPAAAQSAPDKGPVSAAPPFVPPQRWVDACARLRNYHCVFIQKGNAPSQMAPGTIQPGEHESTIIPPPKVPKIVLLLEPNDVTCYSMRTYRVTRDDPDSDSTRPAGYSTCLPATRVQLRTSEDLPERAPR